MHLHIEPIISHYGYVGVFAILMIEMIGIPFPAETTLTVSGFEWTQHVFHLWPLVIAAVLGNVAGSSVAYLIGRMLGRRVLVRFGKYVGLTEERLEAADKKMVKYETGIILVGKFIAGIRVIIPYLAGINRMKFLWFSILNLISAIAWVLVFVTAGREAGLVWHRYHTLIQRFLIPLIVLAVLGIAVGLTVKALKKRR